MWYNDWQHNKCRSPWPIFHGPVILPYILNVIWYINIIIWDYESVWSNSWPKSKCRTLWPIFHSPVILCYILKTINVLLSYFGIMWPIFHSPVILFYISHYSRTSMDRTSLGPWKFVRDMGSSSHWELIIAPGQEANEDNLGKSFRFSI